jgi:hypothetical protein
MRESNLTDYFFIFETDKPPMSVLNLYLSKPSTR